MTLWVDVATGVTGLLAGGGLGFWWGGRRASERAEVVRDAEREEQRREVRRLRDQERLLRAQVEDLQRSAAITLGASPRPEPPPARPTARALETFVGRLRGLAVVDEVAVVTADGLLATRCEDEALSQLGALAGVVGTGAQGRVGAFVAIELSPATAAPVTLRRLPDWTQGAWLVARGAGAPVSPSALDAAISGAFADQEHPPAPPATLAGHGQAATRLDGVHSARASLGLRALAALGGGELLDYEADDGPTPEVLMHHVAALRVLERRAKHSLGPLARVRATLGGGRWLDLTAETDGVALAAVGDGPPLDDMSLARSVGSLRRAVRAAETRSAVAS
ncbi:MAG: hypothetical protein KC731_17775 [Myxococcales bacterium]|nr:hypothetical protein [Myxococcales bacterium]